MRKVVTPLIVLLTGLVILLLVGACQSAPDEVPALPDPDWISRPPVDGAYYIGVGGSHMGNKEDDQERAYQRALKNLAGSISTEIRSESTVQTKEMGGQLSGSFEELITAGVEANLAEVETQETFYSEDSGYWYLVRLSKAVWARILDERAQVVIELADNLYAEPRTDAWEELDIIKVVMEAFYEAYGGRPIKADILDRKGENLDAILISRGSALLSALTMETDPLPRDRYTGDPLELTGRLTSTGAYSSPGQIPLVLTTEDGRVLAETLSSRRGEFSLTFSLATAGEHTLVLRALSPFAGLPLEEATADLLPRHLVNVTLSETTLPFRLATEAALPRGEERVRVFLQSLSPVALVSGGEEEEFLKASLTFRNAPPNEFGMIISYVILAVDLVTPRGEESLWTSGEYKDGGLDDDQARHRAFETILEELEGEESLREALSALLD